MIALERADFRCELVYATGARCERSILCGDIVHFDHIIPCGIGGANTADNCMVLCEAHHREKTAEDDVPRIAKMKRQAAKHAGTYRPSRNPVPGGRNTRWKRTLRGQTILR